MHYKVMEDPQMMTSQLLEYPQRILVLEDTQRMLYKVMEDPQRMRYKVLKDPL